jgi:hypothetical protein
VAKGANCWYGICNQCGDFAVTPSQPDALATVLAHLKEFSCVSTPAAIPAGALAELDRAKAGADATLNMLISKLRHHLAAGFDPTELWNETYLEWCQHAGNPMLAFAFATAAVRLALPQG